MHHTTDRITHTTVFVTPVVEHWLEREIAQWVHHMKDRSDDPSHDERTPLPRSYISLQQMKVGNRDHISFKGVRGAVFRQKFSSDGRNIAKYFNVLDSR